LYMDPWLGLPSFLVQAMSCVRESVSPGIGPRGQILAACPPLLSLPASFRGQSWDSRSFRCSLCGSYTSLPRKRWPRSGRRSWVLCSCGLFRVKWTCYST
jgi:hypothetical protein